MPLEIERKFLLTTDGWRGLVTRQARLRQGYIANSETASVRVRTSDSQAWLNIKSVSLGVSRDEYEYAVPLAEGVAMLESLAIGATIDKTRHWVEHAGFVWEIDEFHGPNEGLFVAEIELEREDQTFDRPDWVGTEVTHLERYYNVCLVHYPYCQWSATERVL